MNIETRTGRGVLAIAAALSATMLASAAEAAPVVRDMSIKAITTQHDNPPHLVMEHDGTTYRWANRNDNFRTKLRLTGRGKGAKLAYGEVSVAYQGQIRIWDWPSGYKTRKFEQTIEPTMGKVALGKFESYAVNWCNQNGGSEKKVRHLAIPLKFRLMTLGTSSGDKTIDGTYPGRIVCMARSEGPKRTPPKSSQQKGNGLKVQKAKLYTIPAKPACGKPVKLVTEIWSDKPGKVDFTLFRGDGEKQNASLTTRKVNGGVAARWAKTYTFQKSVDRKYMIVVKGHKFSTDWVPMKLNCGYQKDHGGKIGNLSAGQRPIN